MPAPRSIAGCILWSLFLFGCGHPIQDTQKAQEALDTRWDTDSNEPTVISIDYRDALLRLQSNPLKLAEWETRFRRAADATKQPYRNLLPRLRTGLFFSESLSDLGEANWSDVSFDVSGHWLFAGLLNLREDLYLAKLNQFQTELLYNESLRRDQILLHELYAALYNAQQKQELLHALQQFIQPFSNPQSSDLNLRIEKSLFENQQQQTLLNAQLGSLLGQPSSQWSITEPPPSLETASLTSAISAENFGILRRQLWAIDIVAAKARARGMDLRKWPQFNLSVNSGTLVNLNSSDTAWFDGNKGVLYSRLTIPIDLTGSTYRNAREAKEDAAQLEDALIQSQEQLALELFNIQKNLLQFEHRIEREEARLNLLQTLQQQKRGTLQLESIERTLNQYLSLEELKRERDRELRRLWFFHEPSWAQTNESIASQ